MTFSTARVMRDGETPGGLFDLNASFIQIEDMGQGRIRKVRDYSVGFTNVPASGKGFSFNEARSPASQIVGQAGDRMMNRLMK